MKSLALEITTPERTALKATVRQVTVPTSEGEITVLPGHIPLLAPLASGELRLVDAEGKETVMAVSGGFVTVKPGGAVSILADAAERAEELDLMAIEAAYVRAEEALKESRDDQERFADLEAVLSRETARLKVARKHASRRTPGRHIETAS